jgi:hypothetical protein
MARGNHYMWLNDPAYRRAFEHANRELPMRLKSKPEGGLSRASRGQFSTKVNSADGKLNTAIRSWSRCSRGTIPKNSPTDKEIPHDSEDRKHHRRWRYSRSSRI